MNKEIKLTKVVSLNKRDNYGECIETHLREISEGLKTSEPIVLIIAGVMKDGLVYQLLTDSTFLEVLGAMDVVKNYFIADTMGDLE